MANKIGLEINEQKTKSKIISRLCSGITRGEYYFKEVRTQINKERNNEWTKKTYVK